MAAAALLLRPVPLGIEAVQQLGKALFLPAADSQSILADGHKAEVPGLAVLIQYSWAQIPRLHAVHKSIQQFRQGVIAAAAAVGQLPADQGRQAGKAVQQPFIHTLLPISGLNHFLPLDTVRFQQRRLLLPGRQAVDHARQHPPLDISAEVHPAHTVHDPPLSVHQDDVGAAADHLRHQLLLAGEAHLVMAFQLDNQHPLIVRLIDGSNMGADQMLAQQHTKHGRLCRVFKAALRQVHPGVASPRRQQQAQVLPFRP